MGNSPSKKMGRTRSKELTANDLADSLAATKLSGPGIDARNGKRLVSCPSLTLLAPLPSE